MKNIQWKTRINFLVINKNPKTIRMLNKIKIRIRVIINQYYLEMKIQREKYE